MRINRRLQVLISNRVSGSAEGALAYKCLVLRIELYHIEALKLFLWSVATDRNGCIWIETLNAMPEKLTTKQLLTTTKSHNFPLSLLPLQKIP